MRMKDITVGEEYKLVSGFDPHALVLEKGLRRYTGGRRDGVKVRILEGSNKGQVHVIPSQEVFCPWAKYEESREADRQSARAHQEMVAAIGVVRDRVIERLAALGIDARGHVLEGHHRQAMPPEVRLMLSPEMLERLAEALDDASAPATAEDDPLTELFS